MQSRFDGCVKVTSPGIDLNYPSHQINMISLCLCRPLLFLFAFSLSPSFQPHRPHLPRGPQSGIVPRQGGRPPLLFQKPPPRRCPLSLGFRSHLYAEHSQVPITGLKLSPELQAHESNCLPDTSIWMTNYIEKT